MNNTENEQVSGELTVNDIFDAIISKIWVVLLAVIVMGSVALIYSATQLKPTYSSTAQLFILAKNNSSSLSYSDMSLSASLTQDYKEIIVCRSILNKTIETLGLSMGYGNLKKAITVANPASTRIIKITVTTDNKDDCKRIVDTICDLARESIVSITNVENVNLIDEGSPAVENKPDLLKYTVLGALAGALLSCCVLVLLRILDDRIKSPDEVEKYLGISILGMIPNFENAASESKKVER